MTKLYRLIMTMFALLIAVQAIADTHVNGYYRKNGTYVSPHYRSDPDSSPYNNWSTQGNVNPYNGKEGTQDPYGHHSRRYLGE